MGFNELYLYNFRNYETLRINVNFPEVYFVGDNGQGKTNLLESLYFLCYGSSFRTKNENAIIRHNQTQMAAVATFFDKNSNLNKISIQTVKGSKKILLNENIIRDRRDIISNMPCIVFCHGDLEFVTGSPDKKRLFFDQTLSLLNYDYVQILRKYKKIIKSKNKILKTSSDKEMINIYNSQLVDLGTLIQSQRTGIVKEVNRIINSLFNKISDLKGELSIEYISSWKSNEKEEIEKFMNEKIDYEIRMKTSSYGPHRDNFKFIYNGVDFNDMGSTGQLRLLSLILRASQGIFYREKSKRDPILLLDDVLLELDPVKRGLFMDNLPDYEQAFFTFLPDNTILKSPKGKVMRVIDGSIRDEEGR